MSMSGEPFDLTLPDGPARHSAARWLKLAVLALLASGVFSILLVLSRTPGVHEVIPLVDFFHTALVVHVDLSVVIWFLAFAGVFWSLNSRAEGMRAEQLAWALTATGTAVIVISPFLGAGKPLLNNYVPVLQHPLFYLGGILVIGGFLLLILRSLFTAIPHGPGVMRTGVFYSVLVSLIAVGALGLSFLLVPRDLDPQTYFEFVFWGSGHVLQFTHTLLLLTAWLWLAHEAGLQPALAARRGRFFFLLAAAPALAAPFIYMVDDVVTAFHREAFTELMRWGGLTALPLGWVVLQALVRGRGRKPADAGAAIARTALQASVLLFAAGGVIGFLIRGANVVIPAHYHGSIVGVTLAFMGVAYLLLPRLGFGAPVPWLARWQPIIYGGGQLMHITGLAISGGYGNIQRKTAGAAQGVNELPEILGMGLMGLGGLVSIIGGILFLVVMIRAIWWRPRPA
jgi:hypothetical protein